MLVVREITIVDERILAPLCLQIKCMIKGEYYRRISFGKPDNIIDVQWIYNGQYLTKRKSKTLEKIYLEKIKMIF